MKAIIEFSLPDEAEEYKIYSKASDMHCALWTFSQDVLRQMDRHGYCKGKEMTEEEHAIVEHIREEFHRILNEYGIDL